MGIKQQRPYGAFKLAVKYLGYFLTSSNGKGHGIHSPFVYQLVRNVLMDYKKVPFSNIPENHRHHMLHDYSSIVINDFGAGSVDGVTRTKQIRAIAKRSLKSKKYATLLYKLSSYYKWEEVIELGTSLGVTTAYLSLPEAVKNVYTIEGAETIAEVSSNFFKTAGLHKIKSLTGDFETVLPELLKTLPKIDMVFMDGDHRKIPTLKYWTMILPFLNPDSCVVLDDIHWSAEMEETWELIKNQPSVTCTIDLFFVGLVFFRKEFKEAQHFQIRY